MDKSILYDYLIGLGYSNDDIRCYLNPKDNIFTYPVSITYNTIYVSYIFTPKEEDIYFNHIDFWNRNRDNVFIAVGCDKTWIINAKEKPQKEKLLNSKKICIKSFDYGVNSIGFEETTIEEIKKEYIDSNYFFDFISKNIKSKKEVDKDLLLNLLALKEDLCNGNNENIIHLLILRCLFVKYLEDRGIFDENFLYNKLASGVPEELISAFEEVCKINGDVFKYDKFVAEDIRVEYLQKLAVFFSSDYRSGQYYLFPYRFDKIPIQLISHVYESFLSNDTKKDKGVYYTPSFIVDFMLSQSLKEELKTDAGVRILDPAVGSGAFLVESFKMILEQKREISFSRKIEILETQLYGVDIDKRALQITAFSLYLALLDGEDSSFIKKEMEDRHPILPNLIGKTLLEANSITDNTLKGEIFDVIICNPPWGSISSDDNDPDSIKEREAIGNKGIEGSMPEYKTVSDYERSQAILLSISKWGNAATLYSVIVKNSIFLNDNALDFRQTLLNLYDISTFYELSNYNKVLFKKKTIGKIKGKDIIIGASEPCAVLQFKKKAEDNPKILRYISPKLNTFSETFECIQFSSCDVAKIDQSLFLEDDILWKILVNGSLEDYKLIKGLLSQAQVEIKARSGFQPKANMKQLGEPIWKEIIEPTDFERYHIKNELGVFNWNQQLRRTGEDNMFDGKKIIVPVRPLKEDKLRLRAVLLGDNKIHKDNIISIKLFSKDEEISDYTPYLGLMNSQLISYLFYQTSAQWGKGSQKRATLRNCDLEKIPMTSIKSNKLEVKVNEIKRLLQDNEDISKINEVQAEIDNIVFELYGLLGYEKEIVKEFYQINIDRVDDKHVNYKDIVEYISTFVDSFQFVLSKESFLNASYYISLNIGTIIHFRIANRKEDIQEDSNLQILNFVKRKQLTIAEANKLLSEEKVKLYNEKEFYIIKSNLFKDWTKRQALLDAREEIELILKSLSKR